VLMRFCGEDILIEVGVKMMIDGMMRITS